MSHPADSTIIIILEREIDRQVDAAQTQPFHKSAGSGTRR
jgi:hypothetical protein